MKINVHNKEAFHFFDAQYPNISKTMMAMAAHVGATNLGYFRIYQGGRYLFFSNDRPITQKLLFLIEENSPSLMKIIRGIDENTPFFCSAFLDGQDMVSRIYTEHWGAQNIIYFRHKKFIDGITLANTSSPEKHALYCTNHIPLLKNLYWVVRDKIGHLIPPDQPGVFAHFPKGADISYQPRDQFIFPASSNIFSIRSLSTILSHYHPYLTHREWEVCRGLMRGETAKETAESLNIEKRTVENHLQNIYRKLAEKWGYRPSRAQILEKLYDTMDKDLLTQVLWEKSGVKSK